MTGNSPHHPQGGNHNRKCTHLISLLSLSPWSLTLSIHKHTHILLLTLIVSASPWPSEKFCLISRGLRRHLLCKSFPGYPMESPKTSALPFVHIIFMFVWKRSRAWKTWTDISIHQLIAWFIPFLYIKLERLRTPCIFLPEKAEGLVMRPVSQYFRQGNSPLNSFGNQLLEEDLQMFLALWEYKEKSLQWENEVNTEIETLCCLKSCFLRNLDLEQMFAKSCSAMTAGKWWTIPGQSKEDMKRQGMCSAYSHAADAWAMFRKSIKKSLWLQ